ncbi:MAG: hypothetical protein AB1728_15070 [Bacteroidota bacterium]
MPVRIPYAHVISGVPDIVLAFAFLATWIDPFALGENMVPYLFQVMLLEFIIIHSSGFMSGIMFSGTEKKKKIMMLSGLGGFYMLFAGGFALGFKSWWPVITFGGLLLNRMLSVLLGQSPEGEEKMFAMKMWGANVVFYLLSVFAVIILPLPVLGVSSDHLSHLDMSGEFVDQPHLMMAWGFLYFLAAGLFELSQGTTVQPEQ